MSYEYKEAELHDHQKIAFSQSVGVGGPYHKIEVYGHDCYVCLRGITLAQWQQIKAAGDAAFGVEAGK